VRTTRPLLVLPWHIFDRLPEDLGTDSAELARATVVDGRPGSSGLPWRDLIDLYRPLADAVARAAGEGGRPITTVSGDCIACLGVLCGLQRAGVQPALVWFDAHGDFHTEATTASGYLGGLPLAKAVGRGDLTLPQGLGLVPLPEAAVVLVDGRDLDPPEAEALDRSDVRHVTVGDVTPDLLGEGGTGALVVHVDLDVVDSGDLAGLRFPAPGGPHLERVMEAVCRLLATGQVAALDVGVTWDPERVDRARATAVLDTVLHAVHPTVVAQLGVWCE